jgi:hypothetical protein
MSENKEFDEVELWLNFIEQWKSTRQEPVPEKLLDLLDEALEKSLLKHNQKTSDEK